MAVHFEQPMARTRTQRRRIWTRERLIDAARQVIARKGIDGAHIADITDAADVGIGSFYNHFASKDDLIATLVGDAIQVHGAALDRLVERASDPAEALAIGIRHTVRMADHDRVWAWFTVRAGMYVRALESVLGRRVMRELVRGIESGRFTPRDLQSALVVIGGAIVAAMQGRLQGAPGAPPDHLIAEQLLRMLGVSAGDAQRIASLPLGGAGEEVERT
jgi:AcrR family transcriptional regulator